MATQETESDQEVYQKLIGLKILNNRSYYLVKIGQLKQWRPITMACDIASDMVPTILKARESQSDMIRKRNKDPSFQDRNKYPILLPTIKQIHEMELEENGDWYCLASFTKPELPPE